MCEISIDKGAGLSICVSVDPTRPFSDSKISTALSDKSIPIKAPAHNATAATASAPVTSGKIAVMAPLRLN